MLGALWSVLTLPFRLIAWAVEALGRVVGLILGFSMMVVGMALMAGPFIILGVPLFVVGLLLTLRSFG